MPGSTTTNLATYSTSGSVCGDGVSFKISHIASLTLIVLAAPPTGLVTNCLHPGDDLIVVSPTTGHYGLVTVLSVSSDFYGVTLTAAMPPEMMSGRDFFLTRVANYGQLTVRLDFVCVCACVRVCVCVCAHVCVCVCVPPPPPPPPSPDSDSIHLNQPNQPLRDAHTFNHPPHSTPHPHLFQLTVVSSFHSRPLHASPPLSDRCLIVASQLGPSDSLWCDSHHDAIQQHSRVRRCHCHSCDVGDPRWHD
jgi:hypothetical protein